MQATELKQVPHGGSLVNLFTEDKAGAKAGVEKTIELTDRQSCDVQLLCNGGFSPLTGFMSEEDYCAVVDNAPAKQPYLWPSRRNGY